MPAAGVIIEVNPDALDCQGFTRSERGVSFTQIKYTRQGADTKDNAFPREKRSGPEEREGSGPIHRM